MLDSKSPDNSNLKRANKARNDEFYTKLEDIEEGLFPYKHFFKGKKVYLPCDNYQFSEFWKYFKTNFHWLGITELTATHYGESPIIARYDGSLTTTVTIPNYDGDFRSDTSIELMQEADIIVTNPPFSHFRAFLELLTEHNKNYIIIAPMNALTYSATWDLFMRKKLFLNPRIIKHFNTPSGTRAVQCWWLASFDVKIDTKPLKLAPAYNPDNYQFFDNYPDVLNVNSRNLIPYDYWEKMAVPVSYMECHDDTMFDILGEINNGFINGRSKFNRIIIQRKQ